MDYPKEYSALLIKLLEQIRNDTGYAPSFQSRKESILEDVKELDGNEKAIYMEALKEVSLRLRDNLKSLTDFNRANKPKD